MLFNSLEFLLLFFPIVLFVALRLKGNFLLFWICLSSFVFYAFAGHVWFLIPMAVTTILDFTLGLILERTEEKKLRKLILFFSLFCNLGLLAVFKYSNLLVSTTEGLPYLGEMSHSWLTVQLKKLILPAGISFYTFQTISYVVDIYRKESIAEKNFLRFIAFVTFFPHLVAGPLTRHNQLIPQLKKIAKNKIHPRWEEGIYLFSLGLIKKIIFADHIATIVDLLIGDLHSIGAQTAWLALLGFTLQIYFDFSGYSDMAIGLGRLFEVELPINFNSPYQATSPRDFWKRWHITLSEWFRDYLYLPIKNKQIKSGKNSYLFPLLLTMVISGMWHGASWMFALWGVYHGALLVLYHFNKKAWGEWPLPFQRIFTFILISLGWVFFRSESWEMARNWLVALSGMRGWGSTPWITNSVFFIPIGFFISQFCRNTLKYDLKKLSPVYSIFIAGLTSLAILMLNYSSRFLYFQF